MLLEERFPISSTHMDATVKQMQKIHSYVVTTEHRFSKLPAPRQKIFNTPREGIRHINEHPKRNLHDQIVEMETGSQYICNSSNLHVKMLKD